MTPGRLVPDSFEVEGSGRVSCHLIAPDGARYGLTLAHGAGAGMDHPFMQHLAEALAAERVATLRYQFPYTERGSRRPDRAPVLINTVRAAVHTSKECFAGIPRFAGGKSMGGRMSSRAAAEGGLDVKGLTFFGFPLHPAGVPERAGERATHLREVDLPMLFLQGERDRLAELDLLRPLCVSLAPLARLEVIPEADHGFHVPKRSGRTDREVIAHLAYLTRQWMEHFT